MNVYILSGARTPSGSMLGQLSTVKAPTLGAIAIKKALEKAAINPEKVDEVFMGNVVSSGIGQNPARQAALLANLPNTIPCTTINKVCGSGLKSIICAAQAIKSQDIDLAVAGGMENMSLAPHLIMNGRIGTKYGNMIVRDSLEQDALSDAYTQTSMGEFAEECPKEFKISRQEQDDYAISSFKKAQEAIKNKIFVDDIAEVVIKDKKGDVVIKEDEGPFKTNFEKIPTLRPAFLKDGTITAANASTINDGGAAVLLGSEKYKDKASFKIISYTSFAHDPKMFTTAPIGAIKNCLEKAQLNKDQIDIFEINEAFACVPLAAIKELALDVQKVNIYGSGISLGHPVGQSGTRIIISLMNALTKNNKKYGLAAICIGGGEALAMIIEKFR